MWQFWRSSKALLAALALLLLAGDDARPQTLGPLPGVPAGTPQSVVVTISSAQLLAINTTPIVLVPAQGANKYIQVLNVTFYYLFGGTAYTITGSPKIFSGPVNFSNFIYAPGAAFFTAAQSEFGWATVQLDSSPPSQFLNQAVFFGDSANWTLGNGTVEIGVTYTVLQF